MILGDATAFGARAFARDARDGVRRAFPFVLPFARAFASSEDATIASVIVRADVCGRRRRARSTRARDARETRANSRSRDVACAMNARAFADYGTCRDVAREFA